MVHPANPYEMTAIHLQQLALTCFLFPCTPSKLNMRLRLECVELELELSRIRNYSQLMQSNRGRDLLIGRPTNSSSSRGIALQPRI
jgi:hypothetical protein